jgi:hypothetical protein
MADKVALGHRFPPRTSASPANSHSTKFSILIDHPRTKWIQSHQIPRNLKKLSLRSPARYVSLLKSDTVQWIYRSGSFFSLLFCAQQWWSHHWALYRILLMKSFPIGRHKSYFTLARLWWMKRDRVLSLRAPIHWTRDKDINISLAKAASSFSSDDAVPTADVSVGTFLTFR